MTFLTRQQAIRAGHQTYLGKDCAFSHGGVRYLSSSTCVECTRTANRAWKSTHRDRCKELGNESYHRRKVLNPRVLLDPSEARSRRLARKKKWAINNADHIREYASEFRKRPNVAAAARARTRAWTRENPDRAAAKRREFFAANPEAMRSYSHARRARKVGAEGQYTAADLAEIRRFQDGKCAYFKFCGADLADGEHVDHAVALANDGSNWPENIQVTCPSCNLKKNRLDPLEFLRRLVAAA